MLYLKKKFICALLFIESFSVQGTTNDFNKSEISKSTQMFIKLPEVGSIEAFYKENLTPDFSEL